MRKHSATLSKLDNAERDRPNKEEGSRAAKRVFGSGGVLEKAMRDEYRRGLKKLKTNSFETPAAKAEWEKFRDDMSPKTLAVVTSKDWQ
jgi:hypothetical protein